MKIFCMSDIHGCLAEFDYALSLVQEYLDQRDAMLILLGDYIHGGTENKAVLDKIICLQNRYGYDKVIALLGNHEELVMNGYSTIDHFQAKYYDSYDESDEEYYANWFDSLPRYCVEGNTIFVHAGINETVGDLWELGTDDYTYTNKFPADIGKIDGLDMKIVAGHIHTSNISNNPRFHDIYYDGASHYYIDGDVFTTGEIPVLMVDTDEDKYYRITSNEMYEVQQYNKEEY